jgi:hypothetical protein
MTALAVTQYGCVAAHRHWRKLTIGSQGGSPNQVGYDIGFPGFPAFGALSNKDLRGFTNGIVAIYTDSINVSSGPVVRLLMDPAMSPVASPSNLTCLELGRTDGSSFRFYFNDPGLIYFPGAVGGNFTEFDWNPPSGLPHVALWTLTDVGKTVFASIQ